MAAAPPRRKSVRENRKAAEYALSQALSHGSGERFPVTAALCGIGRAVLHLADVMEARKEDDDAVEGRDLRDREG